MLWDLAMNGIMYILVVGIGLFFILLPLIIILAPIMAMTPKIAEKIEDRRAEKELQALYNMTEEEKQRKYNGDIKTI